MYKYLFLLLFLPIYASGSEQTTRLFLPQNPYNFKRYKKINQQWVPFSSKRQALFEENDEYYVVDLLDFQMNIDKRDLSITIPSIGVVKLAQENDTISGKLVETYDSYTYGVVNKTAEVRLLKNNGHCEIVVQFLRNTQEATNHHRIAQIDFEQKIDYTCYQNAKFSLSSH